MQDYEIETVEGYIVPGRRYFHGYIPELYIHFLAKDRKDVLRKAEASLLRELGGGSWLRDSHWVFERMFHIEIAASDALDQRLRHWDKQRMREAQIRAKKKIRVMRPSEFAIGRRFYTYHRDYICTDIGTRSINAVEATQFAFEGGGPSYTVAEIVFDEDDLVTCAPSIETSELDFGPRDCDNPKRYPKRRKKRRRT